MLRIIRLLRLRGSTVLVCMLVFAACTAPQRHHTLRIADGGGDLTSLDPHLTMGATMDDVGQLSLAYFMRYDRSGRLMPELITQIPSPGNGGISRDGLRITWHLRHGVRWSDGAPFDARDVRFTIATILNPANDEIGGTEGWNVIRRVETPDRFTVVYVLKRPYGALVPMSFTPSGGSPCILPVHLLGTLPNINTAPYNSMPVGIGPFRIVAWKRGDSIEMEPNPYYWRGRPKLQHVTFKLIPTQETVLAQIANGEVDLWPTVPPTFARRAAGLREVHGDSQPTLRTTHIDFMMTHTTLLDAAVRGAVRAAIDRRRLVATVEHGAGLVTDSIVWPEAPVLRDDTVAAVAPARARASLTADGWLAQQNGTRAKAGRPLALTLVYQSGASELDSIVEVLRAELQAVGITLVTRTYSHTLLIAPLQSGGILASGKYDIALYSSTLVSLPDLASNFDCAQVPPHGENYNHWCDPEVNALLSIMRESYDRRTVARAFSQLNRRFFEEIPSIQLYVWKGSYVARNTVSGYHPNMLTAFDDMMDVDN
jgi:peptide/nickel transport system substrate-binding protein